MSDQATETPTPETTTPAADASAEKLASAEAESAPEEAAEATPAEEPAAEPQAEAAPAAEPQAEAAPAEEPAAEPQAEAAPAEEPAAEPQAAAEAAPPAAEAAAEPAAEAAPAEEQAAAAEATGPEDVPLDPANQSPEMLALYHAMLEKRPIEGQVIGWNKGGYHVAIDKVAAFCPVSQIEIGNPRSPKRYLDKKFPFHVIEIQKGGRRVVLSRATVLQAEREELAAKVRQTLKPGSEHEGKVSSITDFGAFVDLGDGIEGLVHVSEISRQRVTDPKEAVKIGQQVKVMVLKVEKGGQRISLSMKRLEEDPWSKVAERFQVGEPFAGKILRRADFGLFVEVEPGLEGLIHNSRFGHGMTAESEELAIGNEVEGWIHEVDGKRRRLSLSLRPVGAANPWKGIEDRFPEGSVVKGRVERLANFGAFVELEPGLTGLLPFSTLGNAIGNPRKQFHPGKEISVRVLAIDRERKRISLGTEQSKAEGSSVDYREYKKRQSKTKATGLNAMAAAFEKARIPG